MQSAFFPAPAASGSSPGRAGGEPALLRGSGGSVAAAAGHAPHASPCERSGLRFPSSRRYLWDRTPAGPQVLLDMEASLPRMQVALSALSAVARGAAQGAACVSLQLVLSVSADSRVAALLQELDALGGHASHDGAVATLPLACPLAPSPDRLDLAALRAGVQAQLDQRDIARVQQLYALAACASCAPPGSSLRPGLRLGLVMPSAALLATPLYTKRLCHVPLAERLLQPGCMPTGQTGFLSMDQARSLLPLEATDAEVYTTPLVGVWVKGPASVTHPLVAAACLRFAFSSLLLQRVVSPEDGAFLLLLCPEGDPVSKCFEVCPAELQQLPLACYTASVGLGPGPALAQHPDGLVPADWRHDGSQLAPLPGPLAAAAASAAECGRIGSAGSMAGSAASTAAGRGQGTPRSSVLALPAPAVTADSPVLRLRPAGASGWAAKRAAGVAALPLQRSSAPSASSLGSRGRPGAAEPGIAARRSLPLEASGCRDPALTRSGMQPGALHAAAVAVPAAGLAQLGEQLPQPAGRLGASRALELPPGPGQAAAPQAASGGAESDAEADQPRLGSPVRPHRQQQPQRQQQLDGVCGPWRVHGLRPLSPSVQAGVALSNLALLQNLATGEQQQAPPAAPGDPGGGDDVWRGHASSGLRRHGSEVQATAAVDKPRTPDAHAAAAVIGAGGAAGICSPAAPCLSPSAAAAAASARAGAATSAVLRSSLEAGVAASSAAAATLHAASDAVRRLPCSPHVGSLGCQRFAAVAAELAQPSPAVAAAAGSPAGGRKHEQQQPHRYGAMPAPPGLGQLGLSWSPGGGRGAAAPVPLPAAGSARASWSPGPGLQPSPRADLGLAQPAASAAAGLCSSWCASQEAAGCGSSQQLGRPLGLLPGSGGGAWADPVAAALQVEVDRLRRELLEVQQQLRAACAPPAVTAGAQQASPALALPPPASSASAQGMAAAHAARTASPSSGRGSPQHPAHAREQQQQQQQQQPLSPQRPPQALPSSSSKPSPAAVWRGAAVAASLSSIPHPAMLPAPPETASEEAAEKQQQQQQQPSASVQPAQAAGAAQSATGSEHAPAAAPRPPSPAQPQSSGQVPAGSSPGLPGAAATVAAAAAAGPPRRSKARRTRGVLGSDEDEAGQPDSQASPVKGAPAAARSPAAHDAAAAAAAACAKAVTPEPALRVGGSSLRSSVADRALRSSLDVPLLPEVVRTRFDASDLGDSDDSDRELEDRLMRKYGLAA